MAACQSLIQVDEQMTCPMFVCKLQCWDHFWTQSTYIDLGRYTWNKLYLRDFSYFYLISGCAISDYLLQVEDNTNLPLRFS